MHGRGRRIDIGRFDGGDKVVIGKGGVLNVDMGKLVENVFSGAALIIGLGLFEGPLEGFWAEDVADGFVKLCHPFAMLGREADGFAKTEAERIEHACLPGAAFGLVGGEHDGKVCLAQQGGEGFVFRGHANAGIDEEENEICLGDGGFGLGAHTRFQAVIVHIVETGRVDQGQRQGRQTPLSGLAVAGHAGLVIDQSDLFSNQAVEKRRFTDIRPADDGELQWQGWRPPQRAKPEGAPPAGLSDGDQARFVRENVKLTLRHDGLKIHRIAKFQRSGLLPRLG